MIDLVRLALICACDFYWCSGYLAPKYAMRGHLIEKADVFAFGVVALELVSGRPNSNSSLEEEKIYLLQWYEQYFCAPLQSSFFNWMDFFPSKSFSLYLYFCLDVCFGFMTVTIHPQLYIFFWFYQKLKYQQNLDHNLPINKEESKDV